MHVIGNELVTRGRSTYYVRDGMFCLYIAGGLAVAQLLCTLLQWTDSFLFPFGLVVPFAVLIGLVIIAYGQRAWCCRACSVGLEPNLYVEVSKPALQPVVDAMNANDPFAVVAAATDSVRAPTDPYDRLWLDYCPNCRRVAIVSLEDPSALGRGCPTKRAWSGEGVTALLDIAEVYVP